MPEEARAAFLRLRNHLASTPVLTIPRPDRIFAVIVDASTGTEDTAGGVGAILTQKDDEGKFYAVCYASRLLQAKEKTFSPYLLEMAAATWAIKLFSEISKGGNLSSSRTTDRCRTSPWPMDTP